MVTLQLITLRQLDIWNHFIARLMVKFRVESGAKKFLVYGDIFDIFIIVSISIRI